ncbi:MAG: integration host factor subunit alpha [Rickettsiales bacterium]|nr:integration host factor subunit alpha [Rickettsiales bacterium]
MIEKLHTSIGLSRSECSIFLDAFFSKILHSLKEGKNIKIANFGSFAIKSKNSRVGRNPKTKEEFTISARKVIKFKPSSFLINKINK